MKKILSLSAACLIFAVAQAQTPIVLDEDDFAGEGDSYNIVNANPLITFDGDDTGPDYNWDFSDLETISLGVTEFVDPSDTDPLYFFLWLSSDIAQQTASDIVNDFITIEDIFNFYKLDNDEFSLVGFAGTISGIPFPISYDEDEIIYSLPAEYNDVSSSESGFDISVPGFGGWIEKRYRTNENDGWGTITTPSGEYDVLRTRSEILIVDTFTYDVFEIPFSYTSLEYRWMAKEIGLPVLQINAQSILGLETITQVIYKNFDVVDDIDAETPAITSFQVNPNPVSSIADIQIVNDKTIQITQLIITDINGKVIMEKNIDVLNNSVSIKADLQQLSAGTYFVSLTENGKTLATQQIIKQ